MGATDPSQAVSKITHSRAFEKFARAGFVGSGFVHLIIGYLAIRIALGRSGQPADQSGALAELSNKPGGVFVLWLCVAVFVLMAVWRLAEAVAGRSGDRPTGAGASHWFDRATNLGLAAVYVAFAVSAFGFARGSGEPTSRRTVAVSARLMHDGFGRVALIATGIAIIAIGGYHIYRGVLRKFLHDLKLTGVSSTVVRVVGTVGYVVKGLAIVSVGVLVLLATVHSRPDQASGLDGALKTLGAQTFGAALLISAGIGISLYGLYCFAMARYEKM